VLDGTPGLTRLMITTSPCSGRPHLIAVATPSRAVVGVELGPRAIADDDMGPGDLEQRGPVGRAAPRAATGGTSALPAPAPRPDRPNSARAPRVVGVGHGEQRAGTRRETAARRHGIGRLGVGTTCGTRGSTSRRGRREVDELRLVHDLAVPPPASSICRIQSRRKGVL
jgi:hypothetical protein